MKLPGSLAARAVAVAAAALTLAAPALASSQEQRSPAKETNGAQMQLVAHCAGDTVSGNVTTDARAGARIFLALFQQPTRRALFRPTGQQVSFVTTSGKHSYPFSFDVSKLNAYAYAVVGAGESVHVAAASCAPGREVPEAPFPLLLPLSLFAVLGIPALRRRRPAR